jgi:hypothetical protein
MPVTIKTHTIFCDMTPRSPIEYTDVSEDHTISLFMDKGLWFPKLLAGCLFDLHFDPEDRDNVFFQKPLRTFTGIHSVTSESESESESELLYDWRFTANQFVLATSPLRLTTSNFIFQLNTCGYSLM